MAVACFAVMPIPNLDERGRIEQRLRGHLKIQDGMLALSSSNLDLRQGEPSLDFRFRPYPGLDNVIVARGEQQVPIADGPLPELYGTCRPIVEDIDMGSRAEHSVR